MMATSSPACSSKSMPNKACASPYRATRLRVWINAVMTAPRPTGTSVDPPRGCGPAWERPGARPASYFHPHVDAPHFGVCHHLARFALGELAAEIDHEQPVGEGQQRVHH